MSGDREPKYEADVGFESAPYSIGTTASPDYPIRIVEHDDRWVCLEGHIYGRDDEVLERTVTVKQKIGCSYWSRALY